MKLTELVKAALPGVSLAGVPEADVTAVCEDSRRVRAGSLFVAKAGTKVDGSRFLADAYAKGAVAAVVQGVVEECAIPQIVHPDPGLAVAMLADVFFGSPTGRRGAGGSDVGAVKVLGVTGTNGKTTTTYLIRHILAKFGKRCGMIGTVEVDDGKGRRESEMTTPGAVDVAELLAAMRGNGCAAASMEVSSHALHQHRAAAVRFAGAGFTNLTGDHLDYHKTMEEYAAAKAMLFESLEADGVAVVNGADEWTGRMIRDCKARVVRFWFGKGGGKDDYRAQDIEVTARGTTFTLVAPSGTARVSMSLIGRHNIENALTAMALAGEVFGLTAEQLAVAMGDAGGAPGRLQAVRAGQPFAILVDYAHTDDALQNVLTALRPLTTGKLRVVFGCGGDRDKTKRPRMAKVAEALADVLYVTSDNPRTEDPMGILVDIQAGLSKPALKPTVVEVDRRKCIERAIGDAFAAGGSGDVVLIAGKGHENYQIFGTQKHHFDDVEEARRAVGLGRGVVGA